MSVGWERHKGKLEGQVSTWACCAMALPSVGQEAVAMHGGGSI